MTANQYRAALARLGLSQRQAGPLLGATERASRRWVSGESAVPPAAAILLRLLLTGKIEVSDLRS